MKRSKMVTLVAMGSAAVTLSGCDQPVPQDRERPAADVVTPSVTSYASVDDCIAKAVFTEKYCREQFELAQKIHTENAPRFNSQEECAAQFGADACQVQTVAPTTPTSEVPETSSSTVPNTGGTGSTTIVNNTGSGNGGSYWMPAMAGFMLGQALGGSRDYSSAAPRPLYRNSDVYRYYKDTRYNADYERRDRNRYTSSSVGYGWGSYRNDSDYYSSGSYGGRSNAGTDSYSSNRGINSYKPAQQRTQVVARSGFGARASGFGFGG